MISAPADSGSRQTGRALKTRDRLIAAAESLYANQGLDAVSLNHILDRAGQKNRSALQYHFGNRQGLLQAIIDRHSAVIFDLRRRYMQSATARDWTAAELAARVFVEPIAEYVNQQPAGIHYIKILSQMAAANTAAIYGLGEAPVALRMDPSHRAITAAALDHLGGVEASRRTFISVGMVFHSLADIYRLGDLEGTPRTLCDQRKMIDQVVVALAAFYAAPAR